MSFVHLVIVNTVMATIALSAYLARQRTGRNVRHGMLVVMMTYGLITVSTTPSLEEPLTGTSTQ